MLLRALAAFILLSANAYAQAIVADLATPMGTERAAFLPAPGGRATVILLAGGEGVVPIDGAGSSGNQNFLIRTRSIWTAYGINAMILDSPNNASLLGRRSTPAYVQALAAAVDFARSRANVPVWLVGTSQGSTAAANGAAHLGTKIAGVVLTSSVTRANRSGETASSVGLSAIAVPTLVVPIAATPVRQARRPTRKLYSPRYRPPRARRSCCSRAARSALRPARRCRRTATWASRPR